MDVAQISITGISTSIMDKIDLLVILATSTVALLRFTFPKLCWIPALVLGFRRQHSRQTWHECSRSDQNWSKTRFQIQHWSNQSKAFKKNEKVYDILWYTFIIKTYVLRNFPSPFRSLGAPLCNCSSGSGSRLYVRLVVS